MNDPFNRIMVSLDGSSLAEDSLPVAEAFARDSHHEITLLHVLEKHPPATIHGDAHLQTEEDAIAYLDDHAERLRRNGVRVNVLLETPGTASVAHQIAASVQALDIDLVLLATHGQGGLRNIIFGRVAQSVLKLISRPLVIVPAIGGAAAFTCDSIVVPLDGTQDSETVLPYGQFLADYFDASIVLVRIVPTPGTLQGTEAAVGTLLPGATNTMLHFEETEATSYLRHIALEWFPEANVTIDVRRGQVEGEIIQALRQHHADLALVSTHARVGLTAFLEGSIGQRLLERPVCPILLIRAIG